MACAAVETAASNPAVALAADVSWEAVVEAVASGTGASIGVAAVARRWFRSAVRDVVDESVADVIRRQVEFERRQGAHLDRQDRRLQRIEEKLNRR